MCAAFSKHVERNLCYESFHFVQEANAYVAAAQHITAVEQVRDGRVTLLLCVKRLYNGQCVIVCCMSSALLSALHLNAYAIFHVQPPVSVQLEHQHSYARTDTSLARHCTGSFAICCTTPPLQFAAFKAIVVDFILADA
jgi:hypothetical protein